MMKKGLINKHLLVFGAVTFVVLGSIILLYKKPWAQEGIPKNNNQVKTSLPDTAVLHTPQWAEKSALAIEKRKILSKHALVTVDTSPVPVLAPEESDYLKIMNVINGPVWNALSMQMDGLSIAIDATKVSFTIPETEKKRLDIEKNLVPIRSSRGVVSSGGQMAFASWTENGASYSITIECENTNDERCERNIFITKLARSLIFIGGVGSK